VLVGDYYFDHSPQDVQLLGDMAQVAAAAHAPFIAAAAPTVMQMELERTGQSARPDQRSSRRRNTPPGGRCARARIRAISACACRASWLACRTARRPNRSRSSHFEEDTEGADSSKFCWSNAAYAMATNITRAFKLYGWCIAHPRHRKRRRGRGPAGHTFPTDDGGVA
jgi:type VI secretion system protein ImpC